MKEIKLIKHLIFLFEIGKKAGLLQLEDYNNKKNKWLKNPMYAYCFEAALAGVKLPDELKLLRNRNELIIIRGFEYIKDVKEYTVADIAKTLGSMLKKPLPLYKLLDSH